MLPSSLCRLWQPDRAANAAQDNRSYTTAWGTILLRFTNAGGAVQPGVRIVLGMSQRELGNLAGVSREKVNRKLQAWRRAGIITVDKGTIFIRDPAALRSLSN